MLVTRFEIHVSWRIVWEGTWRPFERRGGGGTAPSKASGQAHTQRAASSEQHHQASSEGVGDCCRVRLAPRSSDRGRQVPTSHPGADHSQAVMLA